MRVGIEEGRGKKQGENREGWWKLRELQIKLDLVAAKTKPRVAIKRGCSVNTCMSTEILSL